MLEELKERVLKANLSLPAYGLVCMTWGNVSEIDRKAGIVAIKPSGVSYAEMKVSDIVLVDLQGNKIEGDLNPSSDLDTHLELYRRFPEIGGITHTHSRWATIFAQCGRPIPALGTTHADGFYGPVPCTRLLTPEEIAGAYEENTGKIIAELFDNETVSQVPSALVASHGPFAWGKNAAKSVENAVVLEEVAMMAWHTMTMNPSATIQQELLDKHYFRKHGANATYGQPGK